MHTLEGFLFYLILHHEEFITAMQLVNQISLLKMMFTSTAVYAFWWERTIQHSMETVV